MDKQANSQTIGAVTLMIAVTCVVAFFSLRATQRQNLPPLTIKDAQPSAAETTPTQPVQYGDTSQDATQPVQDASATTSATNGILVHVAGAVFRPDVYRLPAGSRVNDAIRAAGGATQVADTNSINLAAPIQDGSKIYVPQVGEQAAQQTGPVRSSNRSSDTMSNPATQVNAQTETDETGAQTGDVSQTQSSGKLTDSATQGAVNINTASVDELQRLPGIGPTIAQRIIYYRQANCGYKSAEDQKNVSGIGDKKYSKLAAFVTIG